MSYGPGSPSPLSGRRTRMRHGSPGAIGHIVSAAAHLMATLEGHGASPRVGRGGVGRMPKRAAQLPAHVLTIDNALCIVRLKASFC